jgi:hypothetical protein
MQIVFEGVSRSGVRPRTVDEGCCRVRQRCSSSQKSRANLEVYGTSIRFGTPQPAWVDKVRTSQPNWANRVSCNPKQAWGAVEVAKELGSLVVVGRRLSRSSSVVNVARVVPERLHRSVSR